ncbi:hypothetical protein GCM10009527_005450 [Actinomadura nitritigenes]
MQPLRRAEDLAAEAVRDHEMVADGDAEHVPSLFRPCRGVLCVSVPAVRFRACRALPSVPR